MEIDLIIRWLHLIGACVIFGTGTGIAFFMVMAHRTKDPIIIAHTATIVVLADFLFTATAVVAQPVTGALLAHRIGWDLTEPWIMVSLGLYVITGLFWLPVVWIQMEIKKLALQAVAGETELPERYHRLYKTWFACGFPAFAAVMAIFWLMIAKPHF